MDSRPGSGFGRRRGGGAGRRLHLPHAPADSPAGARPLPEYTHPDRALYLFGAEDGSLSQELRDWCEDVVYIPTQGCMNLAATVNVVLYDRLAKGNNTRSGPLF